VDDNAPTASDKGPPERTRPAGPLPRFDAAFLSAIIDTVADPVFVKDRAHRWVLLNDAYCRFMGHAREDLLGRSDPDFFPAGEARVFWARDDKVFESGAQDINEERFTDAAGVTHVVITKKDRFSDAQGVPYLVGVIRDVTDLRQAQEALELHRSHLEDLVRERTAALLTTNARLRDEIEQRRRAEEERRALDAHMQQVQKLESLGLMAGGIAHDFNNLLSGILGNADLALARLGDKDPTRPYVAEIRRAALRSAGLTNQMLAYSGRGHFRIETVDLNALVQELDDLLQAGMTRKVTFRHEFADSLPPIRVDAAQVRQVVMNLITNAAEAIQDETGTVTVGTSVVDHPGGPVPNGVLHWTLRPGRYVAFNVQDTGCGLDPETMARIFDPFFSTKSQGRGLGLAAVLGIVRGHNGALTIRTTLGQGSTFGMLLPAADLKDFADSDSPRALPEHDWRGQGTILVVDDDPMVRSVMVGMLETFGFQVRAAAGGKCALRELDRMDEKPVLVMLDLTMPEMSGSETLSELRRRHPGLRVLLTSGFSEHDALVEADDFLQKPFTFEMLRTKVRGLVERD
jgi:PAS domain S-box-containing protein